MPINFSQKFNLKKERLRPQTLELEQTKCKSPLSSLLGAGPGEHCLPPWASSVKRGRWPCLKGL